ncbi:MAG: hypothetical protein AB1715_12245 [Acidobacteriota bacterium]
MSWGTYGILIAFGLFVLLLILNPRISCFGKRIRSPFYPLLRKKRQKKIAPQAQDYGFNLTGGEANRAAPAGSEKKKPVKKTDDYGFRLD